MLYSKKTLNTSLLNQAMLTVAGAGALKSRSSRHKQEEGVVQGTELLINSGQAAWGISDQAGDLHCKPSRFLEPTKLIKTPSQHRREMPSRK